MYHWKDYYGFLTCDPQVYFARRIFSMSSGLIRFVLCGEL